MKKLMAILAMAVSLTLVSIAGVEANSIPVIDGTTSPGEWDAFYLGTSVTGWQGGMSVDVYGFADETHLYAAYVADMAQPGWAVAAGLCVTNNLYYKTPQTAVWPDPGYTLLAAGGYPADVSQTDGNDWVSLPGSFADYGIEFYFGDGCYNTLPNPNVAEVKIPLTLLTYAGADNQIRLSGQYWQYDWATPFFVSLPPSDLEGPLTSDVLANPNPVAVGTAVDLTATVDDTLTGGSKIASADYILNIAATGPQTLSWPGPGAKAFEFFLQPGSGWKGSITRITVGPSYSLLIEGINVTAVTGPDGYVIYFNLQDAENGSSFKHLGINVRPEPFIGAGGGTLFQAYQQWTWDGISSHGLNPGDLTANCFDLRFDFTKAELADGWTVTPYFRLSGGSWTLFYEGPFTSTAPFDFLGAKLVVGFDYGANGTVSFNNYYLSLFGWQPMDAQDGGFDAVTENVEASFMAPAMVGIYDLCVRGADEYANVGNPECIMLVVYDPEGGFVTGGGWIDSPAGAYYKADIFFNNGFENNTEGWLDWGGSVTRVASGTDGITSADGDWHAEIVVGPSNLDTAFTRWHGYNSQFPPGGYSTSIDIYLDVDGGFDNDTRFDWTSAISKPDNTHRRDFVFNAGFYNDDDGSPGSGHNRFIVSASNNATRDDSYPKNPGRNPIAITSSGWYTFLHRFYDNGGGVLAVDLSILDSSGNLVHTWTLSDPTDIIGTTVGGNRYGWFVSIEFAFLAIDNSLRAGFSLPIGRANFGFVSKYKKGATTPEGNTEFVFKAAGLNFHSDSYDWLIITGGGTNARFKGSGTINGLPAPNDDYYRFMLWAGDGEPDTFRIKIWWEDDSDSVEHVVYDNGTPPQPIGGGSIVIHTSKK